MTFVYGFTSDKTRLRGPIILFALTLALAFWITFQQVVTRPDRYLKYGIIVLTQGFNQSFHVSSPFQVPGEQALTNQPLNATWLSLNCRTPQERAIAMAMCESIWQYMSGIS